MLGYRPNGSREPTQRAQLETNLSAPPTWGEELVGGGAGGGVLADTVRHFQRAAVDPAAGKVEQLVGLGLNALFPDDAPTSGDHMATPQELRQKFPLPQGIEDPFTHDMPLELGEVLYKQHLEQFQRNTNLARAAAQRGLLSQVGMGALTYMMDPLQAATTIVPGFGETAGAAVAGRFVGPRAAALTGKLTSGATAGALSQGVVSAADLALGDHGIDPYSIKEALRDVAMGAAFNSAFHAVLAPHGGVISQVRGKWQPKPMRDKAFENFMKTAEGDEPAFMNDVPEGTVPTAEQAPEIAAAAGKIDAATAEAPVYDEVLPGVKVLRGGGGPQVDANGNPIIEADKSPVIEGVDVTPPDVLTPAREAVSAADEQIRQTREAVPREEDGAVVNLDEIAVRTASEKPEAAPAKATEADRANAEQVEAITASGETIRGTVLDSQEINGIRYYHLDSTNEPIPETDIRFLAETTTKIEARAAAAETFPSVAQRGWTIRENRAPDEPLPAGQRRFDLLDEAGNVRGEADLSLSPDGKTVIVEHVLATGVRGTRANAFGPAVVRQLLGEVRSAFPHAEHVSGLRVTGMREGRATETSVRLPNPKELHEIISTAVAQAADGRTIDVAPLTDHAAGRPVNDGQVALDQATLYREGWSADMPQDAYLELKEELYGPDGKRHPEPVREPDSGPVAREYDERTAPERPAGTAAGEAGAEAKPKIDPVVSAMEKELADLGIPDFLLQEVAASNRAFREALNTAEGWAQAAQCLIGAGV